ncbi:MAG: HAMP domain-containing histidine kinase [Kiritimatiellaeota bacterium]|nr:HAMP domain-containing histidine kinase [Kiritimatiellota bacterium]
MANSQQNAVRRPALRLEHILLMAFLAFALLAGAGLFFLKKTHDRQTRLAATENVLRRGASLLDTLSTLGAAATPEEASRGLSEAAVSIFAVRPDVQSLSVTHGTVTVLQRQAHGFDSHARPPYTMPEDIGTDVTVAPGTLEIGGVQQQVFLLTKTVLLDDGTPVVIEATLKRDAVGQEEQTARAAVSSLSAFSVAVLILSFSACAVVLTLAVVRDRRREQRARQEEHLAFSGVLANGILHDFRNPMSAVRLDAQMLEREMARADGFRPERVTELAGRIAHAMGRMDKVFQEFLFLAKPTDERPERVNLEQAVQACCETLAPRVEHSGVSVRIDAQETPPVAAFPFALRRALLNVLVNALQFAPKGSEVEVALFAAHGRAVIEVRDRGPGIPAGQRARIFEMFVTTRPEGTGLGLFLARTAIRRCGGDIEALARPGGGTIIRISLPESDQWPVTSDQKAANHPSLTTKH